MGTRPRHFCGIDLGTTNSAVAVIPIERRADDPLKVLRTIPIDQYDRHHLSERDTHTLPSCLYFDLDHDQVYTGLWAKEMHGRGDRPLQTLRAVKTRIGGLSIAEIPHVANPDRVIPFDMVQCSALLLKTLRSALHRHLGSDVDEVCITVPAAFTTDERQATRNAARLAGFRTIGILDEPTAALLYYLNGGEGDVGDAPPAGDRAYKLVYDIGGGTLDISIARITATDDGDLDIDIVARSPRMDFGGDDFDQYLAAHFLDRFERSRRSIEDRPIEEQQRMIARLVSKAEEYKIELNRGLLERSAQPERQAAFRKYVDFEIVGNMYLTDEVLTKAVTDELFADVVEERVIAPIRQTLVYAGLEKEQISEVLLTGGMSKFYAVRGALARFWGADVRMTPIDATFAVAKGAAMHHYGRYLEKLRQIKMKDMLSDDLFIKTGAEWHRFLARTTRPGDRGVFTYRVPEDGMTELAIFLYAGIGNDPIGYSPLAGQYLPLPRPCRKGEAVNIEWAMDGDKILTLHIEEFDRQIIVDHHRDYDDQRVAGDPIQRLAVN